MRAHQLKVAVFAVLTVLFLCYSFVLYFKDYQEAVPADALAQKGKDIWQQKNCGSCHQLYGLGGHLGPDLTNVYGKREQPYIEAFLRTGTTVMPNFHLSDSEIYALVAFFKYTNTTGVADPRSFTKHLDGTISQQSSSVR